jgi:hypothetical protein
LCKRATSLTSAITIRPVCAYRAGPFEGSKPGSLRDRRVLESCSKGREQLSADQMTPLQE